MIVPDEFWSVLDSNNDGVLSEEEFARSVKAFDSGIIYGIPFLVYPIVETKYLTDFRVIYESKRDEETSSFATIPVESAKMPFSQSSWQKWYDEMSTKSGLTFFESDNDSIAFKKRSMKSSLVSLNVNKVPESQKYALPLATLANSRIELKTHVRLSERVFYSDATRGIAKEMFTKSVEIRATEQLPDVVHDFNVVKKRKELSESDDSIDLSESLSSSASLGGTGVTSDIKQHEYACGVGAISHGQGTSCGIADDTVQPVFVMVRHKGTRTQNFICGLQFAKVIVREIGQDGEAKGQDKEYTTDDLGRLYLAFTPGSKWKFTAKYTGHDLCYAGSELTDLCPDKNKEDNVQIEIKGGDTIIFLDETERRVDIGLYAGACDDSYTDYSLLITPANGCGSPISVKDTDIKDGWRKVETSTTSNVRVWPYAAMDYYIQLEEAPDVSSLTEDAIMGINEGASCKPPGSNIMQFFRDRNKLVQTLMLLDVTDASDAASDVGNAGNAADATARYEYHGWFCALPRFGKIADINNLAPFGVIDKDEICLKKNDGTSTTLTKNHLIGDTSIGTEDMKTRHVAMKIFEVHWIDGAQNECSTFKPESNPETSLVTAKLQEDVKSKDEKTSCHSSKEMSDDCTFTNVNETDGYLTFHEGSKTYAVEDLEEDCDGAQCSKAVPNLVSPYRRKFRMQITRDDGWSLTFLDVYREFVTLGKKQRGGDGTTDASNDFYATTPIAGLVYTVVHDPPGGNSFASITQGTEITLEVGLTTTRAASYSSGIGGSGGIAPGVEFEKGVSAGTAYANFVVGTKFGNENIGSSDSGISANVGGGLETEGPSISISASTDNSWDFSITLDRVLSSSEDPGLPGRWGDVILGGGFEIVYTIQDKLDVLKTGNECLKVTPIIGWKPDKPTSYVVSYFVVDQKIIPELENLKKAMQNNEKDLDSAIDEWKRILGWSSPETPEEIDGISVALNDDHSVFGQLTQPKITNENLDGAWDIYTDRKDETKDDHPHPIKTDWESLQDDWQTIDYGHRFGDGAARVSEKRTEDLKTGSERMGLDVMNALDIISGERNNFIENFAKKKDDEGTKTVFDSNEDSENKGFFSRGMNEVAMDNAPHASPKREKMIKEEREKMIKDKVIDDSMGYGSGKTVLTFSGGGHNIECTSSVSSNIDSNGYSWELEAEAEIKQSTENEFTVLFAWGNLNAHNTYGKSVHKEHATAWAKHGHIETTYSLGDGDPGDKFVVEIKTDKRFGTPVFKTIGGASKCPAEPGTIWRESGMIIEIASSPGVNNMAVLPNSPALFDVTITNESPYREAQIYGLLLTTSSKMTNSSTFAFGDNMMDLKFSINGGDDGLRPFGDVLALHDVPSVYPNTQQLVHSKVSLAISRGQFSNEYTGIGMKLVSECEWTLSRDWLYRDPISSEAFGDLSHFKWERECPKITWDPTTYNKYLNFFASKNTEKTMKLTVLNPDPLNLWKASMGAEGGRYDYLVHPNVEFVRIQWREKDKGEWINAWEVVGNETDVWKNAVDTSPDVQCVGSRGEGCTLNWNLERQYFLNGLKDGNWEVRAKVFCSKYDSFATTEVKGSVTEENLNLLVDVAPPQAIATNALKHVFTIEYSEPITCPQLQSGHMAYEISKVNTCTNAENTIIRYTDEEVYSLFDFKCIGGDASGNPPMLMITFPSAEWAKQAAGFGTGVYEITVNAADTGSKILDVGKNPASKEKFIARIGCSNDNMHTTSSSKVSLGASSNRDQYVVTDSILHRRKDVLFASFCVLVFSSFVAFLAGHRRYSIKNEGSMLLDAKNLSKSGFNYGSAVL